MWQLFLDDVRDVGQADVLPCTMKSTFDFVVLRSSNEALAYIAEHGFPSVMALDHDLGGDDTTMRFLYQLGQNYDLSKIPPPYYTVHSSNPEGTKNIHAFMSSWLKSYVTETTNNEPMLNGWEPTSFVSHNTGDFQIKYSKTGLVLTVSYIPSLIGYEPWCVDMDYVSGVLEDESHVGPTLHETMVRVYGNIQYQAQTMIQALNHIKEVFDYKN